MKKYVFFFAVLATTFSLGFAFSNFMHSKKETALIKRVTGIGGIFFKCKDPKALNEWYKTHLGLNTNPNGSVFEWRQSGDSSKKGFTQWSPFKESTKYFEPSSKDFMINYRVDNLQLLANELKQEGVNFTDTIETFEYGKFVHILDLEGNKIELWEPNDKVYEKMGLDMGLQTTK